MKRIHIIGIAFCAGLIVGAAVPAMAHATPIIQASMITTGTVNDVNADTCTVEISGDDYEIDCDDVGMFKPGERVTVDVRNTNTVITNADGESTITF